MGSNKIFKLYTNCESPWCFNFSKTKRCSPKCRSGNANQFARYLKYLETGNKQCAWGKSEDCLGQIPWYDRQRINCEPCNTHKSRQYMRAIRGLDIETGKVFGKCKTIFCFNFYSGRKGQKHCTRKCREEHNDIERGRTSRHVRLLYPRTCTTDACLNKIDERNATNKSKYCNSCYGVIRNGTAYSKGLVTKTKDKVQVCKVCKKEFKNKMPTVACSNKCLKTYNAARRVIYAQRISEKVYRTKPGQEYFYLVENDKFYKFGRSVVINKRLADHKRQGLHVVFIKRSKAGEVIEFESMLKRYTKENNLRYTGRYNFIYGGRTETICKKKAKTIPGKWVVQLIKSKEVSNA